MKDIFVKQFKAHPVTIIVFIFGFLVSSLIISIGISTNKNLKNMQIEARKGYDSDSINVNVVYTNLNIKHNDLLKTFDSLDTKTRIVLDDIYGEVKKAEIVREVKIISDIFGEDRVLYPMVEGKFYTSEDVRIDKKVVAIGNKLRDMVYEKNNKRYVNLGNEEFEVCGIVGNEKDQSIWDESVFMSPKVIPKIYENQYIAFINQNFVISNSNNIIMDEIKKIEKNIKKIDSDAQMNTSKLEEGNDIYSNLGANRVLRLGFLILVVAIINVINISTFWIEDRREEFAIRKAFGIENIRIIFILFTEMFSIIVFSAGLAIIIQLFISKNISGDMILSFDLYYENIIGGLLISVGATVCTLLSPIYKIMKLEPIKILRGE